MTATLAHFNFSDQFIGFWGSSGPSQSTIFGSTSVFVVSGSFLSESSLGWPASRSISFSKLELAGDPFSFGIGTVEAGTFSGSLLLDTWGIEDVATSGADSSTFSGSVDGVATGPECGADFGTDAGIASSFVVPDAISGFVDERTPGADGGASATGPDAIAGAIHGSFSSGPGVRAFSKLFDSAAPSAAGTVARDVELSSDIADESVSGAHWAIVEGASPFVACLFAAGMLTCWPLGDTLDNAVAGAVEETGCSGASENASVVDAKDCVSAVAGAVWLSGSADDGA